MHRTSVRYEGRSFTINSRLSFKLLIESWKEKIAEDKDGLREFYGDLLESVSDYPELLEPIDNLNMLQERKPLIEKMMATIFPVTLSDKNDLYAVSIPFTYTTIYSSALFKSIFLNEKGDMIMLPDAETERVISEQKILMSYQMILTKFYGFNLRGDTTTVHPFLDPVTGLQKYLQLELDPRFIEVKPKGKLPDLEQNQTCIRLKDLLKIPRLQVLLPLDLFDFEGLVIIKIKDVTEREVISDIKNRLLTVHSFADIHAFEGLQGQMQKLIGLSDVRIGIAPFFKINNHYVFSDQFSQNSFILKNVLSVEEKTRICLRLIQVFQKYDDFLVISSITAETIREFPFLKSIFDEGGRSLIVCPLRSGKELIGVLSFLSTTSGTLGYSHIQKIEPAVPLFVLALEKSAEILYNQIDRVIKEQFTAVQSSVEWKFTEAALNFLTNKRKGEESKIESIVFEDVYPLYGAIDIRNSSTERSRAIQQDLQEQLELARSIIQKALMAMDFPLLQEINYRIEKYIYTVSNILFSGDEISIHKFLQEEVVQLFNHLKTVIPGIRNDIVSYFSSIDDTLHMRYQQRAAFEESITRINNELAKFIDKEQVSAQEIYPHYFERFVTDGVDFNIYIGQSVTPQKPFNNFYLKNLKLWQLSTLAKAAQMMHRLEEKLSLPLVTTQLILSHNNPISISFRTAERKFDVDGAYNIRYEIIKKRIDKVRIKDTNERLTQPRKIAIVYSQPSEASEYITYIEYLEKQGLLTGKVEKLELEELQGVSGLKALRVSINMEKQEEKASGEEAIVKALV